VSRKSKSSLFILSTHDNFLLEITVAMTVIEEVIRCLKKKEVLELHIELVITPQVGTLDLSSERKEDYPLRERGRKEHMKKQMFQNLRRAAIRCPVIYF
jgi:hypothetical protein